jgi:hypothetical protein
MIRILKRGFDPTQFGVRPWTDCLEGTYSSLSREERSQMIEPYTGYYFIDDIAELAHISKYFQRAIDIEGRSEVKAALTELVKPFQSIFKQVGEQLVETIKAQTESKPLINQIYKVIQSKLAPSSFRPSEPDYLDLRAISLRKIERFLKELQAGEFDKYINQIFLTANGTSINLDNQDIEYHLRAMFDEYVGSAGSIQTNLPFPNVGAENTSIRMNNLPANNNIGLSNIRRNRAAAYRQLPSSNTPQEVEVPPAPAVQSTPAPPAYVETEKERKRREKKEKKSAEFLAAMAEALGVPSTSTIGSARKTRRRARRHI